MKEKPYEAKVIRRQDITDDLFCIWLWLGLNGKEKFLFKPGQYCTIGLNGIWRAYSIVSAPHENSLELFIEVVPPPEGQLTPKLHTLKIGDTVSVLPKTKGVFTFEPKFKNQVMVATVTGIAPFVSMLRDYRFNKRSGHNFYVLQGASYYDEFGYDEELRDLAAAQTGGAKIVYVPTVSRPQEERNKAWRGGISRVNELIGSYLDLWQLAPSNTLIYACGHPGMIQDVKQRLAPQGWKVKEERYWK